MPEVEKILCCDRGGDNALATAAILSQCHRNDGDPMATAAMMGGGMFGANQWMNNPFAYMMMIAMMRMLGMDPDNRNHNGHNAQYIEMQNQLQAIRTQLQDNQNSGLIMGAIRDNGNDMARLADRLGVSLDFLRDCCCNVRASIQEVGGQVGFSAERVINAAERGDCRIIEALKDCCCQNKELVQRMGYENQLGLKDINFNMERGFCGLGREVQFGFDRVNTSVERAASSLGFQGQQDKCDIVNAVNAAQQRTADLLNNHWRDEQALALQDEKFKNSQLEQNIYFRDLIQGNNNCGCRKCSSGCPNSRL